MANPVTADEASEKRIQDSIVHEKQDFELKAELQSKSSVDISTKDEKSLVVNSRNADITLSFLLKHDKDVPPITEAEEKKLARKVMWYIVGLTASINFITYIDKAQLSYSTLLGFFEDVNMSLNRYNNVNTLFYVGYITGQINLLFIQKFPLKNVVIVLLTIWCIIMMVQCAMTDYKGVYVLRLCLGFTEAIIIPALNNTMLMFLTENEKAATAPIFVIATVSVSIPMGVLSYLILLIKNPAISHWKILSIIIGSLTFVVALVALYLYPNNPTDAKFLSLKEKVWVIRRVQDTTGSSIEQKKIKKHQIIEGLRDPISWLFLLFFATQQLANNLSYQRNLLLKSAGHIDDMHASLISSSSGGLAVIGSLVASFIMFKKKNFTAYTVVLWSIPSFIGCVAMMALPDNAHIAMVVMICIASSTDGIPWIMMISWSTTSTSGYSKRLTRIGMVMVGYSISNLISPQLWQEAHGPRYYPAWAVQLSLSFFFAPALAILIRIILARRNKERLALASDNLGAVEIDGDLVKTNLAMLDLTDLENKHFIYPL
ncbi:ABR113Cp [Eremothecium gossypii ATCC 10895]|uniref:ABR113Cp n=1 Tax=Eremothecium gossypii (strain ATCC 10895 / CBS 109.51 / FGSC 9923 / NRRL Y-1056) TaxID=284811 RepID=Q75DB3_EREGS|nr:ABR113Cp [Eremothecium gossypii ATCC 10895]AAS50884.2 ABR113Cp [Eremothecium gossypii ATCC 10895]AEY95173.1 FABR113Cp [Eremothecium gossypii FDAG1]